MRAAAVRVLRGRLTGGRAVACVATLTVIATAACSSSTRGATRGPGAHGASPSASTSATDSAGVPSAPKPRPVPDKTVPQPAPGDIHHTVAAVPVARLAPVPLTASAHYPGGVVGTITSARGISVTTSLPGEIGGPVVELTLVITNGSKHAVPLDTVVVNAADSTHAPAGPVTTSPARPLSGTLAPGKKASGVYVFSIKPDRRDPITVTVSYLPVQPVACFVGNVK